MSLYPTTVPPGELYVPKYTTQTSDTMTPAPSPVQFVRDEVKARLGQWKVTRAAIEGGEAIRKLQELIVPRPNPDDVSLPNAFRYAQYLQRALWYNVTSRTLQGLIGYVFSKEPVVTLPDSLKALETNVDGSGMTLQQQTKSVLRHVLAYGRAGLLVDYPVVEAITTQQQLIDGEISPTIVLYEPDKITNWHYEKKGAKQILTLLVLQEVFEDRDKDNFSIIARTQYRVLRLDDAGVHGQIWRMNSQGDQFEVYQSYDTTDMNGKPLTVIPFIFVGSESNDGNVDLAPLWDLVELNIAHFRNSADYEEACYICGQPTPWVSGLTENWVKEILKGAIHLGSRAVIPLPEKGSAGLLQAHPNTLPFEAMKHKEDQMRAVGARLIEQKTVTRTATEVALDNDAEVSTLVAAASNTFKAFAEAFKLCSLFVRADSTQISYELSEPLSRDSITPQMAQILMELWVGQLVDFEEVRDVLKKAGIAWMKDEVVRANYSKTGWASSAIAVLPARETIADLKQLQKGGPIPSGNSSASAAPAPPPPQPAK